MSAPSLCKKIDDALLKAFFLKLPSFIEVFLWEQRSKKSEKNLGVLTQPKKQNIFFPETFFF